MAPFPSLPFGPASGVTPSSRSVVALDVPDLGGFTASPQQQGGGLVRVARGSKDMLLQGKSSGDVVKAVFKDGIDQTKTGRGACTAKASHYDAVASGGFPEQGRLSGGVIVAKEPTAVSTCSVQPGSVSVTVANAGGGVVLQIPEDLKRRIEALQDTNQGLRRYQDELLHGLGSARGSAASGSPLDNGPRYRGTESNRPMGRGVSSTAVGRDPNVDGRRVGAARRSRGASTDTGHRIKPRRQPASLVQQLRRYHEHLQEQDHRDAELGLVAATIERRLRQSVVEPFNELQVSLEAIGEEQRRMKHEHQQQLQDIEAARVKERREHQAQVLRLEEALLAQGVRQEEGLVGQLKQLDVEWAEVHAASAKLQAVKAEEARLASDALRGNSLRPNPETRAPQHWAIPTLKANPLGSCSLPQLPLVPPTSKPAPPAVPRAASPQPGSAAVHTFGEGDSLPAASSASLLSRLPPGLPEVYEAAIVIILEHGWDALHGGENGNPAWTALHWAAFEGRVDVCELLLAAGADASHPDELGRTAMEYALDGGARTAAAAALLAPVTLAPPPASLRQGVCATSSPSVSSLCTSSPIDHGGPTEIPVSQPPFGYRRAVSNTTNSVVVPACPRDEQCV